MNDKTDKQRVKADHHRGSRHLRYGLEICNGSVRPVSMWLVDQPAVQPARLIDPILTRIDLAGRCILVEAFADPRVIRGTFRKGVGHSYLVEETGIIFLSVPFTELRELSDLRIRIIDASKVRRSANDTMAIAALFDSTSESMPIIADFDGASMRKHPDWLKVAAALGIPAEAGRFEIYVDRAGKYRWQLRRASGEIVADSDQEYATREACEADIQWIRTYVASIDIVGLDMSGGQCEP